LSPTDAVAQGCEFPNGKRLGTPFPVDPEFLQDGGDRLGPEGQSGLPEVVQERLAALGEAAPDDIAEQGRVVDGKRRAETLSVREFASLSNRIGRGQTS